MQIFVCTDLSLKHQIIEVILVVKTLSYLLFYADVL